MKQREDLRPEKREKGHHYLRPATYTLSKEEKESLFDCLNSMKVPSRYSSNMYGRINMKEKELTNLKLPRPDDTIASGCIEGYYTGEFEIGNHEAMYLPQ